MNKAAFIFAPAPLQFLVKKQLHNGPNIVKLTFCLCKRIEAQEVDIEIKVVLSYFKTFAKPFSMFQ